VFFAITELVYHHWEVEAAVSQTLVSLLTGLTG
jgi:hypothetical protein